MNDDSAYELAQHIYAAILWLYRYIDEHDLTFERKDRVDILDYHINRIDAIFAELELPIVNDPTKRIVSDLRDRFGKRHGHAMVAVIFMVLSVPHAFAHVGSPNEMLQAPKVHVPNEELTLPGVTIFISNCY
jgi:hypothetical protein